MPGLFGYFLMGLWWVWCLGGCCAVMTGLLCGSGVVKRVVAM